MTVRELIEALQQYEEYEGDHEVVFTTGFSDDSYEGGWRDVTFIIDDAMSWEGNIELSGYET